MTRVAVSGATGFIGKYVLEALIDRNIETIAIVRDPSKLDSYGSVVKSVKLDYSACSDSYFNEIKKPDILIHLAWEGLPNYKSLRHFEDELPLQYRFLSQLIKDGLSSLLVTGTCFEYGDISGSLKETINTNPTNPYGLAKDTLRRQIECLKLSHDFSFTWTRLFYLYGDDQSANSIYGQFLRAVKNGEKIFNMSGGEQIRDYMKAKQAASDIVSLALCGTDPGIVNICSGIPISIRSLVESWKQELNSEIQLNLGHYPYPDYEPFAFWGDRKKLEGYMGSI